MLTRHFFVSVNFDCPIADFIASIFATTKMGIWNSAHFALSISLIHALEGDLESDWYFLSSLMLFYFYSRFLYFSFFFRFLFMKSLPHQSWKILTADTGYSSCLMTDKHPSYNLLASAQPPEEASYVSSRSDIPPAFRPGSWPYLTLEGWPEELPPSVLEGDHVTVCASDAGSCSAWAAGTVLFGYVQMCISFYLGVGLRAVWGMWLH